MVVLGGAYHKWGMGGLSSTRSSGGKGYYAKSRRDREEEGEEGGGDVNKVVQQMGVGGSTL